MTKWIIENKSVGSLVKFDSALCNKLSREIFLAFLQSDCFVIEYSLKFCETNKVTQWIILRHIKVIQLQLTDADILKSNIPDCLSYLSFQKVKNVIILPTNDRIGIISNYIAVLINRCISFVGCHFIGCVDKQNLLWSVVNTERMNTMKCFKFDKCFPTFNFYAIRSIMRHCINLIEFYLMNPMSPYLQKSYLLKESDFISIINKNANLERVFIHHKMFSSAIFNSLNGLDWLIHLELQSSHPPSFIWTSIVELITPRIESLVVTVVHSKHIKYFNDTVKGKHVTLSNWAFMECEIFFLQVTDFNHIELTGSFFAEFDRVFKIISEKNIQTLQSLDVDSLGEHVSKIFLKPIFKIPIFRLFMHNCVDELSSGVVLKVDDNKCFVNILDTHQTIRAYAFLQFQKYQLMRNNMSVELYDVLLKKVNRTDGVTVCELKEGLEGALDEAYL
jgi:hypothetical protein